MTAYTLRNNLIIFVKYPEPGEVKTRLAAEVGNIQAARIYKKIAEEVVNKCTISKAYASSVYYYPARCLNLIIKWLRNDDIQYYPQTGYDLGAKMMNAFIDSFDSGYKKTIIIGSDCTEIDKYIIEYAFDSLDEHDVVLGPTFDGGYYLIGLKKVINVIFSDMKWSNESVLNETIERLIKNNLKYKLLTRLNDIDTIEDLKYYESQKNILFTNLK